jgi:hypothetical protein
MKLLECRLYMCLFRCAVWNVTLCLRLGLSRTIWERVLSLFGFDVPALLQAHNKMFSMKNHLILITVDSLSGNRRQWVYDVNFVVGLLLRVVVGVSTFWRYKLPPSSGSMYTRISWWDVVYVVYSALLSLWTGQRTEWGLVPYWGH